MEAMIPVRFKDIFLKVAFAHLATLMPDGSPQVTPVWCDLDGNNVRVNSAKGRVKDRNMRRDKKVESGAMRFVLLDRTGHAVVRKDVRDADVVASIGG